MAKVGAKKAAKAVEKKVYFNSEYSFNKVSKLKVGDRRYCLFLKPSEFLFQTMIHSVKKNKATGKGFQGLFDTNIKCKSYDSLGEPTGEKAICCQLYDLEKERNPEKEDAGKRLISYSKATFHVPVAILGHNLKDPSVKIYPIANVSVDNGYELAFLEFNAGSWSKDILGKLSKKLKDESIIEFDLEGEDLMDATIANLDKVVLEVNADEPNQGSFARFIRSYEFIPFTDAKIARATKEHDKITNWETDPDMLDFRNDVSAFLTLLEQNEDQLVVSTWEDESLKNYIDSMIQRDKNTEEFHKASGEDKENTPVASEPELQRPKKHAEPVEPELAEEVIEHIEDDGVVLDDIKQESEIDFVEEDFEFGDDEEFIDD